MNKIFALLFFVSLHAFSQTLPPLKKYEGQGQWRNDGGLSGFYQVSFHLQASRMTSIYRDHLGEHTRDFHISYDRQNDLWQLLNGKMTIGQGLCEEQQCQWTWTEEDGDILLEIWTWDSTTLNRQGVRHVQEGGRVEWSEELSAL